MLITELNKKALDVLNNTFGYSSYRYEQEKIINSVVERYVKEAGKIRKTQQEALRKAQEKQDKQLKREQEKRRLAEEVGKKKRAERKSKI